MILPTVVAIALGSLSTALAAVVPVDSSASPVNRRSSRNGQGCPPLERGSFNIDQYQLYPENADWDEDSCLVYFGVLWNASVVTYDPYADVVKDIIEFPNITNTGTLHIGGVAWDRFTGLITILVDAAAPWTTGGADVSGDNLVIKWDPVTGQEVWTANLTETTQGRYGAFQDIETDACGFTYVVGTFPGSILRVSPDGTDIVAWYPPTEPIITTVPGLGGLVAVGPTGNLLLANDAGNGRIYRFDTSQQQPPAVRTEVPIQPDVRYNDTDAIYAPPRYGGTVLLVSSHAAGIQVLRSRDASWTTAEHLGTIPNPPSGTPADVATATNGSFVTAAVQMGSNGVYIIDEFLLDPWVPGQVAGNRTVFPMPDITDEIEALLLQ